LENIQSVKDNLQYKHNICSVYVFFNVNLQEFKEQKCFNRTKFQDTGVKTRFIRVTCHILHIYVFEAPIRFHNDNMIK